MKQSPISRDPLVLQSGLDFLQEDGAALLQDCLHALGNQESICLSLPQTAESAAVRPLALFARRTNSPSLLLLALPRVDRQIVGCVIGCIPTSNPIPSATIQWVEEVVRGPKDPLGGWIASEVSLREAQTEKESGQKALLTLAKAIQELCHNREPQTLLRRILGLAIQLISPAQSGGLFLEEGGFLRIKHIEGIDAGTFHKIKLSPGEGLPGKVFLKRQPLRLVSRAAVLATAANLTPENRKTFTDVFKDSGIPSGAIAVPMMVKDRAVGVLLLDTFSENTMFSNHDIELLQQFANLSAVVLETERLLDLSQLRAFLLDQVRDAVVTFDAEGKIKFHNAGAQKLWGWENEQTGQPFVSLFDPESRQRAERAATQAAQAGHAATELRAYRPDGKKLQVLASISTVRDENNLLFVALLTDLTDRDRVQALMGQAAKMESIGALAGGIAHDFNNFLSIIHGYSTLLQEKFKSRKEPLDEMEGIQRATESAAALTAKLVAFSRGSRATEFQPSHLGKIVEEALHLVKGSLGPRIQVEVEIEPKLPLLLADPVQMQEILVNLAMNSREAMPRGGAFRVEIRSLPRSAVNPVPKDLPGGQWVLLKVSDTGSGMEPEVLERIFEPFFTTKESPPEGAGLGCTMVYSIVRSHKGWVEVESSPKKGSEFRIYLPAT